MANATINEASRRKKSIRALLDKDRSSDAHIGGPRAKRHTSLAQTKMRPLAESISVPAYQGRIAAVAVSSGKVVCTITRLG